MVSCPDHTPSRGETPHEGCGLGTRLAVKCIIESVDSICRVIACCYIRERGSVLYLGMAKEISKYHTDAPAGKRPKKLLPPKPSMQTE